MATRSSCLSSLRHLRWSTKVKAAFFLAPHGRWCWRRRRGEHGGVAAVGHLHASLDRGARRHLRADRHGVRGQQEDVLQRRRLQAEGPGFYCGSYGSVALNALEMEQRN